MMSMMEELMKPPTEEEMAEMEQGKESFQGCTDLSYNRHKIIQTLFIICKKVNVCLISFISPHQQVYSELKVFWDDHFTFPSLGGNDVKHDERGGAGPDGARWGT